MRPRPASLPQRSVGSRIITRLYIRVKILCLAEWVRPAPELLLTERCMADGSMPLRQEEGGSRALRRKVPTHPIPPAHECERVYTHTAQSQVLMGRACCRLWAALRWRALGRR